MSETNPEFILQIAGNGAGSQFHAQARDEASGETAEHNFEWRVDSVEINLTLSALAQAARASAPPAEDLHARFGRLLYAAVFAGEVGALWQKRRSSSRRGRLPLVVQIDPERARPLLNLPWEYLHDEKGFLALDKRVRLARRPWGMDAEPQEALYEPLRLLVMIAAPLGLGDQGTLNPTREEELILEATAPARRAGLAQIEFTPNGSLEALEAALLDFDPHILHFTGHGAFDPLHDRGSLLMEDTQGCERSVPNAEFAGALERARALRLVTLSACQTAVHAQAGGFADLGPRLLLGGIPAVLAMQHSVPDRSATALAGAFYKAVAGGEPLDEALWEGRQEMKRSSPNQVDFATPVLYLSDPACLALEAQALKASAVETPKDLSGVTAMRGFVGRSAELRKLQTELDPERGRWRAAVVHGMGGMGKTVLAARLAERLAPRLDGVVSFRVTPTTTAQMALDHIAHFLLLHNAAYNLPAVAAFDQARGSGAPLEVKAGALVEVLKKLKLLVIFDNCEDILPGGQEVSREAQALSAEAAQEAPVAAGELRRLISLLVGATDQGSRFLFTSRVDFEVVEANRLGGEIGRVALPELGFREAVYLMETLPPLDRLLLSGESARAAALKEAKALPAVGVPTMREVFEKLGGHPYALVLFARQAAQQGSVRQVLDDLGAVTRELAAFTLLERAVRALPARAAALLRRAAVYDEAVEMEGLAYLLGDAHDVMPEVGGEIAALLGWGLLAQPPGTEAYALHALVKTWAREQWGAEERLALLNKAAAYWQGVARDSGSLGDWLSARHYLFEAGEYEAADDIVNEATEILLRWGQIELLLGLLNESARTLQGGSRAVALGNLATVLQGLGAIEPARQVYEQVLEEFERLGDRRNIATALHQLGMLHEDQGEYAEARKLYEQSLAIFQELGDRAGAAGSLHQLGMLHQQQAEFAAARKRYEQALAVFQELGDRAGTASSLDQIGVLLSIQGDNPTARSYHEQALKIRQEIGDRQGMAISLHNLGILHQDQGETTEARKRYEQSLAIKQELGNRAGAASSLHNLGNLHYLQGEYTEARKLYEQSLAIDQELGNRAGMATSLHQLGMLHQEQGEVAEARKLYEQSLAIKQALDDRAGMADSLHQLGMLHQDQGEVGEARKLYEQSLAVFQELGDRAGMANSLAQLGLLLEKEGHLTAAVKSLAQALVLFEQLGAPQRNSARKDLARLREKLGEEAFNQALAEAGAAVEDAAAEDGDKTQSQRMTKEQVVQAVVHNTVVVLTEAPQHKADWWNQLGAAISQVQAAGDSDFATFLEAARMLVEGRQPEGLAAQVPAAYREAWQAILEGLRQGKG
jgi:tetratricopeptide (TPR) repeat protein